MVTQDYINIMVRIVLFLSGLSVFYLGIMAFFNITYLMEWFVGVTPTAPYGTSEIRTLFGGVLLVFSIVVLGSSIGVTPISLQTGVNLYLGFVGGVLLGRFYTLFVEGFQMWTQYGGEKQVVIVTEAITFILVALYYIKFPQS